MSNSHSQVIKYCLALFDNQYSILHLFKAHFFEFDQIHLNQKDVRFHLILISESSLNSFASMTMFQPKRKLFVVGPKLTIPPE